MTATRTTAAGDTAAAARQRAASLVLAASLLLCLAEGWVRAPAAMDLPVYTYPARLWLQGADPYIPADYEGRYRRAHPGYEFPFVGCPYPPSGLLVMAPIAVLPDTVQPRAWWVVSFMALVAALGLLLARFGREWSTPEKLLVTAVLAQSRLVQAVAYRGQPTLVVLVLVLAAWALSDRRRPVAAGLCLALGLVKVPLVVPLVLYLAWRRDWRSLAWGAAFAAGLSVIAALPLGLSVLWRTVPQGLLYEARMASRQGAGEWQVMHWQALFDTAFGTGAVAARVAGLATLVVAVAALALALRPWRGCDRRGWAMCGLVAFSLAAVYHRVYDGVFLFPVAGAFWGALRVRRERPAGVWLAAVPLALLLFVFAPQQVAERASGAAVRWSSVPVLAPVNAWLTVATLAATLWACWHFGRADRLAHAEQPAGDGGTASLDDAEASAALRRRQ